MEGNIRLLSNLCVNWENPCGDDLAKLTLVNKLTIFSSAAQCQLAISSRQDISTLGPCWPPEQHHKTKTDDSWQLIWQPHQVCLTSDTMGPFPLPMDFLVTWHFRELFGYGIGKVYLKKVECLNNHLQTQKILLFFNSAKIPKFLGQRTFLNEKESPILWYLPIHHSGLFCLKSDVC